MRVPLASFLFDRGLGFDRRRRAKRKTTLYHSIYVLAPRHLLVPIPARSWSCFRSGGAQSGSVFQTPISVRFGLEAAIRCRAAHSDLLNVRSADKSAVRCGAALAANLNDRCADKSAVRCGAALAANLNDRFADEADIGRAAALPSRLNVGCADKAASTQGIDRKGQSFS